MSKKKKKKGRPIIVVEGAPEWMVTFGDLMSLLLTFFILLFSISEVKSKKIYEVFQSFQTHFQIDVPSTGFHIEQLSDVINLLSEMALELPDQKEGAEGKTQMEVENPFGEHAEVVRVDDYLRITIAGSVVFDENQAQLTDQARALLSTVRDRLKGNPNRVRVIGHANPVSLPPESPFQDHHELAYKRARAVATYLTANHEVGVGLNPQRLEIGSRGKTDLIPSVKIWDPIERRKLDRVEIMVTAENALRNLRPQRD